MSNETVQQAENICLNPACIHMTHAREPSYKSYAYGSGQKLSPEGSYWFFNLSRGVEQNPPPPSDMRGFQKIFSHFASNIFIYIF